MQTSHKLPPANIIPNINVSLYEQWITSALQGDVCAEYKLAYYYLTGDGPPKNSQIALYWFDRAAVQGHVKAIFHLGFCYQHGCHIDKDEIQAVRWYDQAAKNGYGFAQDSLAKCYEEGIGVEKNLRHALYWFQQASNRFEDSNTPFERIDTQEIKKSIQRLLTQNIIPSNKEDIPTLPMPEEKKEKENITLLTYKRYVHAAKKGGAEALRALAHCYRIGAGVEKNNHTAQVLYYQAAQQGNHKAIYYIGENYQRGGQKLPKNARLAALCYETAAKKGYRQAYKSLGWCYEAGIGVEKNLSYALYCYQQIAGQVADVKRSVERLVSQNITAAVDIPSISIPEEKKKISASQNQILILPHLNKKESKSSASYCVDTVRTHLQCIYSPATTSSTGKRIRRTLFFKSATLSNKNKEDKYPTPYQHELINMKKYPDRFPILIFNSTIEMQEISALFKKLQKGKKFPAINKQKIKNYFEENFLEMLKQQHGQGSIFIVAKAAMDEDAFSLLTQKLAQDKWYTSLIFYGLLKRNRIPSLAEALKQNTRLQKLIIGSMFSLWGDFLITDREIRFLTEALETNTTLTHLSIGNHPLPGGYHILSVLWQRLQNNNERKKKNDIDPLLKALLDRNPDSSQINLRAKQLGNKEVVFLIDYLSNNIQFPVRLDLCANFIGDTGAIALAEFLERSGCIKKLESERKCH